MAKRTMKLSEQERISEEAVQRGIRWLDANVRGWRQKINVGSLEMRYPCDCILGQLDGDFYRAVWERNLSKPKTKHLGFAAIDGVRYPTLTAAWRRALRALVEAA